MKEKAFGLISLLLAISLIALLAITGVYFKKYGFENFKENKENKENLIKEAEQVKNQETEFLKKQIEEAEEQ